MGLYFGAGDGRCPSSSKTVYAYYTRKQLAQMQQLMAAQDAAKAWAISKAAEKLAPVVASAIKQAGLTIGVNIATDSIISVFTSNSKTLANILMANSGSGFTLKLSLGCINKGLNGHYWAIRSLAKV